MTLHGEMSSLCRSFADNLDPWFSLCETSTTNTKQIKEWVPRELTELRRGSATIWVAKMTVAYGMHWNLDHIYTIVILTEEQYCDITVGTVPIFTNVGFPVFQTAATLENPNIIFKSLCLFATQFPFVIKWLIGLHSSVSQTSVTWIPSEYFFYYKLKKWE